MVVEKVIQLNSHKLKLIILLAGKLLTSTDEGSNKQLPNSYL